MSHMRLFRICFDGYLSRCLFENKSKNTVHAKLISKCSFFLTFISILFLLPCDKECYFYECLIKVEILSHFA